MPRKLKFGCADFFKVRVSNINELICEETISVLVLLNTIQQRNTGIVQFNLPKRGAIGLHFKVLP